MNALTAIGDLRQNFKLIGQPEERFTKIAEKLCEAIKECLNVFPDKNLSRRAIDLYPCEVLAAQHFLTQLGFHLQSLDSDIQTDGTLAYGVFPNWSK